MIKIKFKYREGDIVTIIVAPELGLFEVNGQHCINGAISYTINDGDKEQIKYEYQLELHEEKDVEIRKIGFKRRPHLQNHPSVIRIGKLEHVEVDEE